MKRSLGRSGVAVSPLGFGCWAIGGPFSYEGRADGWGSVDDDESLRALRRAFELGITFFDTADVYGTGHSETLLGKAFAGKRDQVVISTKFGNVFDAATRQVTETSTSPTYIRAACASSLQRLGTDYIDLYLIHLSSLPPAEAEQAIGTLEELRQEGTIRAYGWSTDDLGCAQLIAGRPGCAAIEHELNLFNDSPDLIQLCEQEEVASLNRSPLAMGLLSGKFDASVRLPRDDVRGAGHDWVPYFENGAPKPEFLDRLAAVREILTSEGRTLAQGALAWVWARSTHTIPIPGFKTVAQAEENAGTLERGPLGEAALEQIDALLRPPPRPHAPRA